MPSIRRSIRNFRRTRDDAFVAGARFCDGCAKVADQEPRFEENRRTQASALSLYGLRG